MYQVEEDPYNNEGGETFADEISRILDQREKGRLRGNRSDYLAWDGHKDADIDTGSSGIISVIEDEGGHIVVTWGFMSTFCWEQTETDSDEVAQSIIEGCSIGGDWDADNDGWYVGGKESFMLPDYIDDENLASDWIWNKFKEESAPYHEEHSYTHKALAELYEELDLG